MSWYANYSPNRLITFVMALIIVFGIPAGLLCSFLVTRVPSIDGSVLSGIAWTATTVLPLIIVLALRKTGKDRWLLRKDCRRRAGDEPNENI